MIRLMAKNQVNITWEKLALYDILNSFVLNAC